MASDVPDKMEVITETGHVTVYIGNIAEKICERINDSLLMSSTNGIIELTAKNLELPNKENVKERIFLLLTKQNEQRLQDRIKKIKERALADTIRTESAV